MKSTLTTIPVEKLQLDINNPRFAELYSGSENEDELIEYLLYNESAEEVAKGITNAGEFYPDRPLWVIKNDDIYLIKDGNRRCAAVKALSHPAKYGLSLAQIHIKELPVLIYNKKEDLESRIIQEHANSLFREWDRIAKALEVYKLYSCGSTLDSMKEIDSQPSQLIKLASFYYEAVKIGGVDLKKLLRRGRGKSGGKTIIFERLFAFSKFCGYSFRNKPSYKIFVNDKTLFKNYINALIQYLIVKPETKTQDVDNRKGGFLKELEQYGFTLPSTSSGDHNSSNSSNQQNDNLQSDEGNDPQNNGGNEQDASSQTSSSSQTQTSNNDDNQNKSGNQNNNSTSSSVKTRPVYTRKKVPATLDKLIKECYSIDANQYPNAKTALSRVTFECVLKYVVENTRYNGKTTISNSSYFRNVFYDNSNTKRQYTDFSKLKPLFSNLITVIGIRKAFENFDIERTHQIIHNYHVGAIPADAKGLCDNLIPLIEFMLQSETELISSLERSKL